MVPHHTDLLENNIHVNKETGQLTGICDWKDTKIGPFGVSLWNIETMFGISTWKNGWVYHANQQELREVFWDSFWDVMGDVSDERRELIKTAALVGLFVDNAFTWVDDENKVPAGEGHEGLRFVDMAMPKLVEPKVK